MLKFEAGNLKLDKKTWRDLDIYFVGYVDKRPEWNVNSVNPLHLLINSLINRFMGLFQKKMIIKF